jgi:hypothetical protein
MTIDYRIRDGKRCELIAADWLISQGCHVFTHVMEQGPVDVVALSPKNEWLFFDVKKASRRRNGSIINRTLTKKQQKLGVRLLYVDIDTGECHLYPHQFNPGPVSEQNAANRWFKGVRLQATSSLLRPKSPPQD